MLTSYDAGIKKLGSKGPMVLDDKWNGNAFFDHNSGRFEVCRKTGERLRIQFKTRELVRFMTTFEGVCNTLNTAKVTTRYSHSSHGCSEANLAFQRPWTG